ncbi:MAG: two-component system nitrogen regulation sensor histidine kinase GlnL [Halioglobus sp.]|jgi:two-component system nitrogen regulation sensor histidine kinase GlnL
MQYKQDILDNLSTGIITLDGSLTVTSLNAAAQVLLELSASRAIGTHAAQLILRDRDWLTSLEQGLERNSPLTRRGVAIVLQSGQEIHVDLIVNPIPIHDDSGIRLIVELQAVDRFLKISREEGIIHAQETTRTVIRGLAHEIKNPLGGVRGAAQLLAKELPSAELKEYTQVIIREADRLRDLVDRLLGPNHQMSIEELNIHEILEHVRNLVAAESGNSATIERDYDPSIPEIQGDRSQLIQVVLNIMLNALQAAKNPEDCTITVRTRTQRQFTIGAIRHRLVSRVEITDNGPGIPMDLQHAIFAPMVTGRSNGTGLGLSIAQSIVNRHGGLIQCESEPGNTTFIIYLPMEVNNAR